MEHYELFSVAEGKYHKPAGAFERSQAWRPTLAVCGRTLTPLNYFATAEEANGHTGGRLTKHLCKSCAAGPRA